MGDSIIAIDYKNEFGFKVYNAKILKPPILTLIDIKGLKETHYKGINSNLIIYSTTYFGEKNLLFNEKDKLLRKGVLKESNSRNDFNCNLNLKGLIFIFNNKKSFIVVKESNFDITYNKIERLFYNKYGVTGKDSFVSLPQKYLDSSFLMTYKTLWNKNVVRHVR